MFPLSEPNVFRRSKPYVTYGLILLNAIVFVYELTLGNLDTTIFYYTWGLIPAELAHGVAYQVLRLTGGQTVDIQAQLFGTVIPTWGTVFTSMFIHSGFTHIIGNMMFLLVFGDHVEEKIGHIKFLLFYFGCGIAAAMTHVYFAMDSQVPTVGASGAIAGVLGAYLLLYPFSRIRMFMIQMPAVVFLGGWFVLQLFNVGSLGTAPQSGGVAYWAHIGGFIAGGLLMAVYLVLRGEPIWTRYRRRPWRW